MSLASLFVNWLFEPSKTKPNRAECASFQAPNPHRNPLAARTYIEREDRLLHMDAYYRYLKDAKAPADITLFAGQKLKRLCDACGSSIARDLHGIK